MHQTTGVAHRSRSWGLNIRKLGRKHRRLLAIAGVGSPVEECMHWWEVRKDLLQGWVLVACRSFRRAVMERQLLVSA